MSRVKIKDFYIQPTINKINYIRYIYYIYGVAERWVNFGFNLLKIKN